jgi:mannose-1-phosphate guanylyltransferase
VVTRQDQSALLASQVPDLPSSNFINEPVGRGTAPAIGLAAVYLQHKDPEAVMAVLTADHFITNHERFHQALKAASSLAQNGNLVTLGIKPTSPSSAFGYIEQEQGGETVHELPFFRVKCFTEKPSPVVAQRMIASGKYSWNSGMFIWRADRILEEFEKQMPELYSQLLEVKSALVEGRAKEVIERVWNQVKEVTIDYGVMEYARDIVVIPVDIGWTDVGNWASLAELLPADKDGNIFIGPCKEIDTQNTLVFGGKRLVATIGLKDIVIVDSEDALLVCARSREQEVREIVERLKASGESQWL